MNTTAAGKSKRFANLGRGEGTPRDSWTEKRLMSTGATRLLNRTKPNVAFNKSIGRETPPPSTHLSLNVIGQGVSSVAPPLQCWLQVMSSGQDGSRWWTTVSQARWRTTSHYPEWIRTVKEGRQPAGAKCPAVSGTLVQEGPPRYDGSGQAGFLFLSVLAIRLHAAATWGGGVIKVGL